MSEYLPVAEVYVSVVAVPGTETSHACLSFHSHNCFENIIRFKLY